MAFRSTVARKFVNQTVPASSAAALHLSADPSASSHCDCDGIQWTAGQRPAIFPRADWLSLEICQSHAKLVLEFLFFLIKKKFISKSGAHSSKDESETQYSMVENPSKSRWVPSGKPFSLISKRSEIESTKKTGLPLQFNR